MTKCEHDKLQDRYIRTWPNNADSTTSNAWDQLKELLTEEQQTELYQKAVRHANHIEEITGSNFRYLIGVNTEF